MAETPNVMPQLHMPLQSGSDRCSRRCAGPTGSERYLGIIDRVRAAMPDAAITTDIIVGFPGETEDDFAQTLDVVREARFAGAFTFQYSQRPGTPAADAAPTSCPRGRAGALRAAGRPRQTRSPGTRTRGRSAAARAAGRRGRGTQGRRHAAAVRPGAATTGWCTSRPPAPSVPRPGDVVDASRSPTPRRTTWSPTARRRLRRTRAGDAWEARQADESGGVPAAGSAAGSGAARPAHPARLTAAVARRREVRRRSATVGSCA